MQQGVAPLTPDDEVRVPSAPADSPKPVGTGVFHGRRERKPRSSTVGGGDGGGSTKFHGDDHPAVPRLLDGERQTHRRGKREDRVDKMVAVWELAIDDAFERARVHGGDVVERAVARRGEREDGFLAALRNLTHRETGVVPRAHLQGF